MGLDSTWVMSESSNVLAALGGMVGSAASTGGNGLGPSAVQSPTLGVLGVMTSAFFGACFAFLFTQLSAWLSDRWARGKVHRNALVRLERIGIDYLNEIITNRRLAAESAATTARASLYWRFPHTFEVDRNFSIELLDLDMAISIAKLNTDLRRYNHDVETLCRAHADLQHAHLGQTLPLGDWQEAMGRMAPHWGEFEDFFGALDDSIRDILVRARLLVAQYDGGQAQRLRWVGQVKTWPLEPQAVQAERKSFDRDRIQQLAESRIRAGAVRAGGARLTAPESGP